MVGRGIPGLVVAASLALSGCGDATTAPSDSGAADGTVDAPADADTGTIEPSLPAAPTGPAAPVSTPCPEGWREVAASGSIRGCYPWPEGGRRACESDQTHFPGEPGCVRIGSACPAGNFPEGLDPKAAVVYVLASAATGGDGSMAAPFTTVSDALATATAGTIVAIGKGTYDETIVVPADVTLWGACVAETKLTSALQATRFEAVVEVPAPGVTIRNLSIADTGLLGVVVTADGVLELTDVIVRNTIAYGAFALGGDIQASSVLIDRTVPYEVGAQAGGRGRAVQVALGSTTELRRTVLSNNVGAGAINFGSTLRLEDVAVLDTTSEVSGEGLNGTGISTDVGGLTEARRCVLEGNHLSGFKLVSSEVVLEDVLVRQTRGQVIEGNGGEGIVGFEGVRITATRLWLNDNQLGGVSIYDVGPGSIVSLTDSIVQASIPGTSGGAGYGLYMENRGNLAPTGPSRLELNRVLVTNNHSRGIDVSGAAVELHAEDLMVEETRGNDLETGHGVGISVTAGAFANLTRTEVAHGTGVGVLVRGDLAEINDGTTGQLRLSDAHLTDVEVRETSSLSTSGALGRGLQVQYGQVAGERVRLSRNREVALMVFGGRVDLSDVIIADTLGAECGSACPVSSFGHGVYKGPRADVSLDRFEVAGAAFCGVVVDGPGVLELRRGAVRDAEIGACLLVDDYDIRRLTDDVLYSGNGSNLDSPALPSPDYLTGL